MERVLHVAFRLYFRGFLFAPSGDGIVKRHYAGAFGELAGEARTEVAIDLRQQIQRHNRGVAQIASEKVLRPKADALAEAVFANFLFGMTAEFFVHLDSHGARPKLLRGHDGDSTVAGAEVVYQVAGADVGEFQHLPAHGPGRRCEKCSRPHFLERLLQASGGRATPAKERKTHRWHCAPDGLSTPPGGYAPF